VVSGAVSGVEEASAAAGVVSAAAALEVVGR
jgi:hypothetical protein